MEIESLGPYKIVGKLGRGGMGTVYEGVHSETGESAAVKLLSASLAQEEGFRVRFEAEIETLRKLNHPNIVRLFGFGEQEGHLFYAMELVRGNSLEEELQRGRRFDWRESVRIGIEMCRALRHAHDRGIIHRDIKPGNLLLGTDGCLKLSDFGIARLFGNSRLTGVGNVVGTAEYMAPEQAEGRPVDVRSDLYSLGAVMYALLARRPVFRGKSLVEVLHKQRFESPEPVRNHAPETPEEFERILAQLLEKDADRRMPNANVLGRRLEAMVHALSDVSETTEAEADWFLADDPAPEPELPKPAQQPADDGVAQTLDQPADGLPRTQELADLTDVRRKALEKTCQDLRLQNPPPEASDPPAPVADPTPRSGRFVAVSEDELDPVDEGEPQPWISLQTWALAASLLLVGLSVWWFLQPPTADALYARIAARTEDGEMSSILQAENDINDFIISYSNDPRAGQMRAYERDIGLYRLEKRFERVKGSTGSDDLSPIEQMYLEAIGYVRLDPARGMAKLQALVELYNQPEDTSVPTGQSCLTLANRRLTQLRKEVDKMADDQLPRLKARLDTADAMRQEEPDRAMAMYRAVIELYGDKPWAADVVNRARESLAKKP